MEPCLWAGKARGKTFGSTGHFSMSPCTLHLFDRCTSFARPIIIPTLRSAASTISRIHFESFETFCKNSLRGLLSTTSLYAVDVVLRRDSFTEALKDLEDAF
jgi:hypothetical protein